MRRLHPETVLAGGFAALMAVAMAAAPARARPHAQPRASSLAPAPPQGHPLLGGLPPVSLGGPCLQAGKAYLRARIRGAVRLDVDLRGRALRCVGGPRLDGSGIRLGFEGRAGAAGRIRMIFGIDGAKEARAGRELPTNLTVIFEDRKLLFATQGTGNCTVDRMTQEPVSAAAQTPGGTSARMHGPPMPATPDSANARTYRVVAHGFCIAPANDLSGRRRILVTTFDFAGRADFNSP